MHDDRATVDAGPRAHFDEVIGGPDRVLVVLDDDDRVADVAQPLERRDHLHVVLRMQPDARLVEHVEHPHQPGSDLCRQADALRLAAGQRAGPAIEAEVVEPDSEQELETGADLLEHLPARVGTAPRRADRAEEAMELVEVEPADVVDRPATDGEEQPRRSEAGPVAVRAGVLDHHLVEPCLRPGARLAALPVAAVVPARCAGRCRRTRHRGPRHRRAGSSPRAGRRSSPCAARCRTESTAGPLRGGRATACRAKTRAPTRGCTSFRPSQVSGL